MSRSRPSSSATGSFCSSKSASSGRLVLNQPAGHLEDGETLLEAVVRETLRGNRLALPSPRRSSASTSGAARATGRSFLRFAFCGARRRPCEPRPASDRGIVSAALADPRAARGNADAPAQPAGPALHRRLPGGHPVSRSTRQSPGSRTRPRFARSAAAERPPPAGAAYNPRMSSADRVSASASPAASIPPSPRCCSARRATKCTALFMSNWDDDDDGYCTAAAGLPGRARASASELGIPLHR